MTDTVNLTVLQIALHVPVITEVTPQSSYGTLQDWKNAILQLVELVESRVTPSEAGTYWGGVLLDEEEGFWQPSPNTAANAADLADLTSYTVGIIANAPCCNTYVYSGLESNTANGGSPTSFDCDWDQSEFNSIIGLAVAAPQVVSDCMAARTNAFEAQFGRVALVTWSLGADYNFQNYVRADNVIGAQAFFGWSSYLSYCFANGEPCNDWDGDGLPNSNDADTDGDGCSDASEVRLGLNPLNPWDFYSVPVPALFIARNPVGLAPDASVDPGDASAIQAYFERGAQVGSADYEADRNVNGIPDGWDYDRSVLGPAQAGPPDGVITPSEAQLAFAQFERTYTC